MANATPSLENYEVFGFFQNNLFTPPALKPGIFVYQKGKRIATLFITAKKYDCRGRVSRPYKHDNVTVGALIKRPRGTICRVRLYQGEIVTFHRRAAKRRPYILYRTLPI